MEEVGIDWAASFGRGIKQIQFAVVEKESSE